MKKSLPLILTIFYFTLIPSLNAQQAADMDFVYAGVGITFVMQMERVDYTILFRKDGTFCEDLHEEDWQTKVNGRYKETKDYILMEYLDKTVENDTIFFEENKLIAEYYGTQVIRMEAPNKVPSGYYSFYGATSSGGIGTGMVYVGTQHFDGFNFYDNGRFDRSTSGGVVVSGNNIGGGTSSESDETGRYTIKNGLLTLYYDNGEVEKNSFFYDSTETEEFMVVINGSIFFYGDEEEEERSTDSNGENRQEEKTNLETSDSRGRDILAQIKNTHGGTSIDALKRIKTNCTVAGMAFKILIDADKSFVRLESLEASFPYIAQLEGDTGWIYQGKKVQSMPSDRIRELQDTFVTGLFGLRKDILNSATIKGVNETDNGLIAVGLMVDGRNIGYIVDGKTYTIVATVVFKQGNKEITYASNFKTVENILLPFTEVTESDGTSIEVIYTEYNINPVFTKEDWAKLN
ncbi:MAG: hypothetical protein WBG90_03590 [Saonia sp.]